MEKNQLLNCMKLTLLFLTISMLSFTAVASAQRVSITANNVKMGKVLEEISQQTGLSVAYSNEVVNLNRLISINVKDTEVDKALNQIMTGTNMTFEIKHGKIYLSIRKEAVASYLQQQTSRHIIGTVKDSKGQSIIGANVIIKGTTNGTATDVDGKFALNCKDKSIVEISSIGFVTQNIQISKSNTYNIVLIEDTKLLDEVVVIGYGAVKKSDLTGSVSSVKSEQLTAYTVTNPVQALQGRVPGVMISQNTGDPAGDYSIRVRGVNSIKGSNDPLYIIDGIPASTSSVNTYDIESIEVLKDASATAIYGSRGANGVVLITTKRGKSGKANVTYNYEYGNQKMIKKLDLMNSQEWAHFYNEYLVNADILKTAPFSDSDIAAMGEGTDWQSLIFGDAPTQTHSLTISGGAENIKYFVSGSALVRDGLIPNSNYNKYNIRNSLDFAVNPYIDISVQLGYTLINKMNQSDGGGNGGSSMIGSAFSASPLFYPYNEDGSYKDLRSWFDWSSHEVKNPLCVANEYTQKTSTNLTNGNAAFILKPIKGLQIKGVFGLENSDSRYDAYTTKKYIYSNNSASVNHQRSTNVINEEIVTYDFTLNNIHKFNIMGAYTYEQTVYKSLAASGNTFLSDVTGTNDLGSAATVNTPTTSYSKWVLESYLGRLNYSFNNKYLLTASIRADGSSRYSEGKRWGYFPSGAIAWRISSEPFMKRFDKISDMKLRFGYGQTGSTAIDPYSTQNLLKSGKTATGEGNYSYYSPKTVYPGDLKWETTTQWDGGLDLALYNNRFRITADYYYKKTTNLLNTVYLPTSSGYSSTTKNIGSMSNKGVELLLEADIIRTKDFGFTAQFNIAHNKNEVLKLADGLDIWGTTYTNYGSGPITIIREGEPMGAFYVYKDAGINETGQLSYVDFNGDGKYTDTDDRYIAGSPFPDFTYGLNCGFRYKDWDFSFFLQGSQGNEIFNLSEMRNYSYSQGMNIEKKVYYESWREGQDNSKAKYPKIENVGPMKYSDRFVENGSYLRLKNILLGYNLPCRDWKTKNWLQGIRFYVSAQNYLTITGYNGVDPEVSSKNSDLNNGIDHLTYPNSKTLTFGAQLQF